MLDVHRRREFVEGKVTWIDDADAVEGKNHNFPSDGLGDARGVFARSEGTESYAVGTVENRVLESIRFGSAAHASISDLAMRTKPQAVYSQNEWSSSSITQ